MDARFYFLPQTIEGLGGRLVVLGEAHVPSAAPHSPTSGSITGVTPLEELATLINEAAPFCPPPKRSRWDGLLQLFAATAMPDGLGNPTASPVGLRRTQHGGLSMTKMPIRGMSAETEGSAVDCWGGRDADVPALCEALQRPSIADAVLRCSYAACRAICRPMAFAMRLPPSVVSVAPRNARGTDAQEGVTMRDCECNSSPERWDCSNCSRRKLHLTRSWTAQNTSLSIGGERLIEGTIPRPQKQTLRELIDNQQRTMATYAMQECLRKLSLLEQERRASHQHVSKALMDDRGQLFPQVSQSQIFFLACE